MREKRKIDDFFQKVVTESTLARHVLTFDFCFSDCPWGCPQTWGSALDLAEATPACYSPHFLIFLTLVLVPQPGFGKQAQAKLLGLREMRAAWAGAFTGAPTHIYFNRTTQQANLVVSAVLVCLLRIILCRPVYRAAPGGCPQPLPLIQMESRPRTSPPSSCPRPQVLRMLKIRYIATGAKKYGHGEHCMWKSLLVN